MPSRRNSNVEKKSEVTSPPTTPEQDELLSSHAYPELENSPIESVRATVSTVDNRSLPVLTFRFWILGTLFIIVAAAYTQYYYFTPNPSQFSVFFVQLASYPLGKAMARWLPEKRIRLGNLYSFTLNPGPFNMKEHAAIGVAVSSATIWPYAVHSLSMQQLYFTEQFRAISRALLLVSSQCLGYGVAGLAYSILVEMPQMVWPSTLVNVAFYNTLHETKLNYIQGLSRMQFFWLVFGAIFLWELFPKYIAPVLVSFTVICWIAGRKNPNVSSITSSAGLGIGSITFDWTVVQNFTPLSTPWWAQANYYFGTVFFLWIIMPIAYYTNLWNTKRFPITSSDTFNITGGLYNAISVINQNTSDLDEVSYSPARISAYFALAFGCGFIAISSVFTHVYLWHRRELWAKMKDALLKILLRNDSIATQANASTSGTHLSEVQFSTFERNPQKLERDACIHANLMKAYPQVPTSWYCTVFLIMLIGALTFIILEPSALPVWGLLVAIVLALVCLIPVGVIQATTGIQVGLNILSEVIGGYMFPGRPITNTMFKTYSYWCMSQGLIMLSQFKLGQYMKIPPRKLFLAQIYGTFVASIVQYLVTEELLSKHRHDILKGSNGYSSALVNLFFSSAVLWGAIGPERLYAQDSPYFSLVLCWFIGLLLPIPFYFAHKWWPRSWFPWRLVNVPIMAVAVILSVQMRKNFVVTVTVIGFLTQFWAYRYRHSWWRKHNYVGNAALDAGAQISALLVFLLTTGVIAKANFPTWIGNNPRNYEQCGNS